MPRRNRKARERDREHGVSSRMWLPVQPARSTAEREATVDPDALFDALQLITGRKWKRLN
jgi:hypothetical protein